MTLVVGTLQDLNVLCGVELAQLPVLRLPGDHRRSHPGPNPASYRVFGQGGPSQLGDV